MSADLTSPYHTVETAGYEVYMDNPTSCATWFGSTYYYLHHVPSRLDMYCTNVLTYVPYGGTFGASNQGQMLDV